MAAGKEGAPGLMSWTASGLRQRDRAGDGHLSPRAHIEVVALRTLRDKVAAEVETLWRHHKTTAPFEWDHETADRHLHDAAISMTCGRPVLPASNNEVISTRMTPAF